MMGGAKNDDDAALWMRATSTVNPLDQDRVPFKPKKSLIKGKSAILTPPLPPPVNLRDSKTNDICPTEAERIRNGQIPISAELNLHHKTIKNAEDELKQFIAKKRCQQPCYVKVITGKGKEGKGVIRKEFPEWLYQLPLSHQVEAFYLVKERDGKDGGVWYLKLRARLA